MTELQMLVNYFKTSRNQLNVFQSELSSLLDQ